MAVQSQAHPAIAAGLASGIGLILPAAAYAATISVDGLNGIVRAGGMPFAIGAVAGAGLCAVAMGALSARSDEAPEIASRPWHASDEDADGSAPSRSHERAADMTGMFGIPRRPRAADVPVISRAEDALPEDRAWEEIDSIFDDGSPISCDATSKDIYQIALEELARKASSTSVAPGAPVPSRPVGRPSSPVVAVDARVPMIGVAAHAAPAADVHVADEAACAPLAGPAGSATVPVAFAAATGTVAGTSQPTARIPRQDDSERRDGVPGLFSVLDTDGARRAAVASLDSLVVERPAHVDAGDEAVPAGVGGIDSDSTHVIPAMPSTAIPTPAAASVDPALSAPDRVTESEPHGAGVPVADYSGHEDMWARALAILADDDGPVSTSAGEDEGARLTGRHFAPTRSARHGRRPGHEYLSVIQGGTSSFPALRAEA